MDLEEQIVKKTFAVLSVILMLSMLLGSVASAQTALPGSGWWTGEQVQNVGGAAGTIAVTAYDKNSAATFAASTSVNAGAATTFLPGSFAGMPSGFQGSAVVSSDQPIKAIVTITDRLNGALGVSGGLANAQYQGMDSSLVARTLYFPMAKGNHYGYTTAFYIQNAGTAATTATASFKMRDGTAYTYQTPSIGPNQQVVFSVLDAPGFAPASNNGRVGAMSITADTDQALAGVVTEYLTLGNPATKLASTRGFTAAEFDTTAYAPTTKNARYGHFTGIQVQNVSAGSIDITVSYKGTAGACAGQSYQDSKTGVVAGAAATFNQLVGQSNLPANCTASATVVATGNILATVNELNQAPASDSMNTYSAMPAHTATTKVSAPLFKDDRYGNRIGLMIQNVGGAQANNIVATFACTGGASFTAVSNAQSLADGAAFQFFHPSAQTSMFDPAHPFSSANVNCGVTITSDQKIVAIANETFTPGATLMDDNNYEGFNLQP